MTHTHFALSQESASPVRSYLKRNALPLACAFLCILFSALGWKLFAQRLDVRARMSDHASSAVERIWGGPLAQGQPAVLWRRADASTVELTKGELAQTRVEADLDVQYRQRGVTEFPGYELSFGGDYDFVNPSADPIFAAFRVPLPAQREALMLQDVRLLVDGKEFPEQTEYSGENITWTGQLRGHARTRFRLAYRARGLERFSYALAAEDTRPITGFGLTLRVRGASGELDYPVGSMAPTATRFIDGGKELTWQVDRLLTSFDVGVVLPHKGEFQVSLRRLVRAAPWFFGLFAIGLFFALAGIAARARALHVVALSGAYFLFFPLATYLAAYLPWALGLGLSFAGIGAVSVVHALRFVGRKAGALVGLSQLLFLGVPTLGYVLPSGDGGGARTGLVLVLGAFVALSVAMHLLGQLARRVRDEVGVAAGPRAVGVHPVPVEPEGA